MKTSRTTDPVWIRVILMVLDATKMHMGTSLSLETTYRVVRDDFENALADAFYQRPTASAARIVMLSTRLAGVALIIAYLAQKHGFDDKC